MNFLTKYHIENLKTYKYYSEDNCFLTLIYKKFWIYLSKFIPRNIHPNFITICGLFSVIIGWNLKNFELNNLFMSIGIFLFLNFDGIDGIHARNTKQTSIIGEYSDHLCDLIVTGLIANYILEMLGYSNNILFNNLILYFVSFEFFKSHWDSIYSKKIIFSGTTDVSLILTLSITSIILNLKMPNILINNYWIILVIFGLSFLNNLYLIYKKKSLNKLDKNFNNMILLYWIIKFLGLMINPTINYWSICAVDLLILLETINFKIFSYQVINKFTLLLVPLIYFFNNFIGVCYVILFILFFLFKISKQLEINLFFNPPSKYLHRVYCCGVFDLCHIGHMKLFEKISKSFDNPIWLIVGVHSDETVKSYKREPIINEKFRVDCIKLCKYVDEVWENADLIVTKEFCLENNIDYVIIGEEYKDNKDKIWYKGGIELNIHKYISRFEELSTTDIIKKINLYKE